MTMLSWVFIHSMTTGENTVGPGDMQCIHCLVCFFANADTLGPKLSKLACIIGQLKGHFFFKFPPPTLADTQVTLTHSNIFK